MADKKLSPKVGAAVKWSTITEIIAKLISPILNMILARLLSPEAFGLVATVTMVVTFAEVFTDAGFQKYIVQHEFQDAEDLDSSTNVAFWTNFVFFLLFFAAIVLFADPIAVLVGSEGAGTAIIAACVAIPLVSFSSIQMARYRRSFDFKTLFVVRMVTSLLPLVVTVPLALILKNHWALIIGTLAKEFANAFILTIKSKWKPKLEYDFAKLKQMFSFSMWSMFEQITIWLTSNLDIFIVGRILNAHYLGLYKTSMTTVNAYMGIVTAATTPVLFSALSRCQNDEDEFRKVFFKFQRLVAVLVLPMGVGLFLYRRLATEILLGNAWMEAADFIGLWALTSALTIIFSHYNSEVYRSKGKPRLSMLSQGLHLVFLIGILVWLAPQGFSILCFGRSMARLQLIILNMIVIWYCFGISAISIFKNIHASLIATLCMGIIGLGLQQISATVIWNFISIAICVCVYFAILLMFPKMREELMDLSFVKKLFRKMSKEV